LKTDNPTQGRQHGTDQDIFATGRVLAFVAIPLDVACIERSLNSSLVEQGIEQPKRELSAEAVERPSWPKHTGRFEPLRKRADHD
jgi:hypothetical protein